MVKEGFCLSVEIAKLKRATLWTRSSHPWSLYACSRQAKVPESRTLNLGYVRTQD